MFKLQKYLSKSVCLLVFTLFSGTAAAQEERGMGFAYPIKFICGPSSEAFQEGLVKGLALTAINVFNPTGEETRFDKRVSRALPYQLEGAQSAVVQGNLGAYGAMKIECNEIRQMLPSQMTEEYRAGYLLLRSEAELVVTAIYSARPLSGEISALEIEQITAIEAGDPGTGGSRPDLTITNINLENLRIDCPNGQGSCIISVPVTVQNIGAGGVGPFQVRTSFDPRQTQQVFEMVPGLGAGESLTFDANAGPGDNCFDPDCRICALADVDMSVAETDETNNELCVDVPG